MVPPTPSPPLRERLLVLLLRVGAVLTGSALFAALLPTEWMASVHRALGLGAFPESPLTEYLTRSISLLYAAHGGVLFVVSTDVRRYRPLVIYLGWLNIALGAALTAIDLAAPLPLWWTLSEGPWVAISGVVILALAPPPARMARPSGDGAPGLEGGGGGSASD